MPSSSQSSRICLGPLNLQRRRYYIPLEHWDLLTPLNSTASHGDQNPQQILYKNLKSHRVHDFLNPETKDKK